MAEKNISWLPPIKNWYKVSKEAYSLIYQQAKERFEDVMSESESITNKSIKMIFGLAAFLGGIIGFYKGNDLATRYMGVFFIFILIEAILLFILIVPKDVRWRGLSPKKSIPENLDSEDDREHQTELVYYYSISILQDNIDFMIEKNTKRALIYKIALILFLMIFASTATFIIASLSTFS